MSRPKLGDPKRAVTIRLPASLVARYEAMGGGWRAKMEAVVLAAEVNVRLRSMRPTVRETVEIDGTIVRGTTASPAEGLQLGPRKLSPGARLKKR